ncbi:MAG: DUF5050 domain-containing protein, partial [Clostridiaceae bacterium]
EAEINLVGSTPGNLTSEAALNETFLRNGLFTTQGSWIYFMLPNADYYVYKVRLDGTGFTSVGDARGSCLNVVGDWLYYKNLNDQDMAYRIRTDGTQMEKLQFNKADNLAVTKDWFYYTDESLFRAKTDGSEPERLLDGNYAHMSYCDDWVYYNTTGGNVEFMRIPAEGGEPQKLLDGWMLHYDIRDGWLYCLVNLDQKAVVRMRPDGSEKTELYRSEYVISSFDVSTDKLIVSLCKQNDDRGKPYPSDVVISDLTSGAVLHELKLYAPGFNIAGDNAYFLDEEYNWKVLHLASGTVETIESPVAVSPAASEQPVSGESGNSAANLQACMEGLSTGLIARAGTTLYFANPKDNGRFCMSENNGDSGFSKFVETCAASINATSNAVYYLDTSDNNSIYSASPKGENPQKIVTGPCYDLSCIGSWLFYHTAEGVFKVPASGGEPALLVSGQYCCVYAFDGFVYYVEDNPGGGFWRVSINGGEPQPLLTDYHALFYTIQEDTVYCLIDAGNSVDIVRMKFDGSKQETIYSSMEKLSAINASETYLLIVKAAEDGKHSMILVQSLDGKETIKTINDLSVPAVWCFGNDAYYITDQGLARQNLDSGDLVFINP